VCSCVCVYVCVCVRVCMFVLGHVPLGGHHGVFMCVYVYAYLYMCVV